MLALKAALYLLTIASAFFFAFWERKIKRQLTDEVIERFDQHQLVSDFDSLYDIRKEMARERLLRSLPREALFSLRVVVGLKFLSGALLVVELIFLQR